MVDSLTSMPDAVHRKSRDLKFHSKDPFSQDNESENVETCQQSHQLPDPALVDKLTQFYSRLKTLYYSDPLTLGPAIESCCNQALISSDSSIVSALHWFGKYKGATTTLSSRRALIGLKTIGVQPTALARRKMTVGGRRRCYLGRPPRSSFPGEHSYAVKRPVPGGHCHVMPKRRAPHSLQQVVDNVEPLGGSHHSK